MCFGKLAAVLMACGLGFTATADQIKLTGKENDLFTRIVNDPDFALTEEELKAVADPLKFTGMAELQCETYLRETIFPLLEKYSADKDINMSDSITV